MNINPGMLLAMVYRSLESKGTYVVRNLIGILQIADSIQARDVDPFPCHETNISYISPGPEREPRTQMAMLLFPGG
jgi:hypothetical protein